MKVQHIEDKRRIIDMSASDEKIAKNINSFLPYLETTVEKLKLNVDGLDIPMLITKVNEEIYKYYSEENTEAAYLETNLALYLQELMYYKKTEGSSEIIFDLKTVSKLEEEYYNLLRKQDSLILHRATENARAMNLIQENIQDAYLALCYESTNTVFTKDVTFDMLEIAFSKQEEIIQEIFEIDTMTLLMGFYDIILNHKRALETFRDTGNESVLKSLVPFTIVSNILPSSLIEDLTCEAFSIDESIKYPYQNLLIQKKPFIRFNDVIYCFNPIALGNSVYSAIKHLIKEYDENLYEKFLANECDTLVDNYNLMHILGPCNGIHPVDQGDEYIPFVEDILQVRPSVRTLLSKVKSEDINDYDYNLDNHSHINALYNIEPIEIEESPVEVVQEKEATANQLWAQSLASELEPAPVVQPRPLDLNSTFTIDDDLKEILENKSKDEEEIEFETTTGELNSLEDYLKSEDLEDSSYQELDELEEIEDLNELEENFVNNEEENTDLESLEEHLKDIEDDVEKSFDTELDEMFSEEDAELEELEKLFETKMDEFDKEILETEDSINEDEQQQVITMEDVKKEQEEVHDFLADIRKELASISSEKKPILTEEEQKKIDETNKANLEEIMNLDVESNDYEDDDLDDMFENEFMLSGEAEDVLEEDTLEDELLESEDDYEDPNQLIMNFDESEDELSEHTQEDELLEAEDDFEEALEELEDALEELENLDVASIVEEAFEEALEDAKKEIEEPKKDVDIFAKAEVVDLIDMNLPKYVKVLADVCERDGNRQMYNWILNMGTSSNNSFNGLLENIYKKMNYDNSDKMVNLPEANTTVLFYTDEDNEERDKQRLHNVAATMKVIGEFRWTAYHIIYNNMGEIIRTKTSNISKSEFSETDWQTIENMALALSSRKR